MIFHENRLLADDSHEISYLFFRKIRRMSQKLSSAAVVICALRVNRLRKMALHLYDSIVEKSKQ